MKRPPLHLRSRARRVSKRGLAAVIAADDRLHRMRFAGHPHARTIESAFRRTQNEHANFSGWALSRKSLRTFVHALLERAGAEPQSEGPLIVELGGGASTRFWAALAEEGKASRVVTFEHHPEWAATLAARAQGTTVDVRRRGLRTLTDGEKKQLFTDPDRAAEVWPSLGRLLQEVEFVQTRIPNTFYDLDSAEVEALPPIDGLIVDGPHGSGRSLCFPLLYRRLAPGTLVLLDDFDHYDFLGDLARLFTYEELERSRLDKHYVVLRLTGKR